MEYRCSIHGIHRDPSILFISVHAIAWVKFRPIVPAVALRIYPWTGSRPSCGTTRFVRAAGTTVIAFPELPDTGRKHVTIAAPLRLAGRFLSGRIQYRVWRLAAYPVATAMARVPTRHSRTVFCIGQHVIPTGIAIVCSAHLYQRANDGYGAVRPAPMPHFAIARPHTASIPPLPASDVPDADIRIPVFRATGMTWCCSAW